MQMPKEIFIDIKVNCALQNLHPEKIRMFGGLGKDGKYYFDNNGCDNHHACKTCVTCSAALSLMFFHGFRPKGNEIVTPDVSMLQ